MSAFYVYYQYLPRLYRTCVFHAIVRSPSFGRLMTTRERNAPSARYSNKDVHIQTGTMRILLQAILVLSKSAFGKSSIDFYQVNCLSQLNLIHSRLHNYSELINFCLPLHHRCQQKFDVGNSKFIFKLSGFKTLTESLEVLHSDTSLFRLGK